ncbi:MAG: hypothetical protein KAT15_02050, partial [Bacteroidales bacterium]|nr:hypothetical protein [Bacteroidales bacterium]
MDISRNNYESWFLDYLDGRLNAAQEEILLSFLEFNQDLRTELGGFENLQLEAEESGYDLKASLRKPVSKPCFQDLLDEFEGYCVSSVEQQLSPEEENMLREIIEKDKSRKDIYRLYESTLLRADEGIRFPGKSRLKKRFIDVPAVRITIASAAAVAVLLIAVPWLLRNSNEPLNGNQQVADITEENHIKESYDEYDSEKTAAGPIGTVIADDLKETGIDDSQGSGSEVSKEGIKFPDTGPVSLYREQILLTRLEPIMASELDKTEGETISGTAYRL